MKTIYEALTRRHHAKHFRRRKRFQRFRLRTLMTFTTGAAVFFALLAEWGMAAYDRVAIKWQQIASTLATDPADGMIFFLNAIVGVLLGAAVSTMVYRMNEKRGFLLFCGLSCVGLIALSAGLSLDTPPLNNTELRDLRFAQVARVELLWLACVVPVSAFLGWYCATLKTRS